MHRCANKRKGRSRKGDVRSERRWLHDFASGGEMGRRERTDAELLLI